MQISLMAGLMFVAAGTLRLGFLTNFLSHTVISGFATGSAIIIAVSQACAFRVACHGLHADATSSLQYESVGACLVQQHASMKAQNVP